jgi:hypothetical protein
VLLTRKPVKASRLFSTFLSVLAMAATCGAAESVYLTNGFRLEAEWHENTPNGALLHTGGGTLEVARKDIDRIDVVPEPPKQPSRKAVKDVPNPESMLTAAAIAQGLPPDLVRSVAKIESSFRQRAVSPKGAIGLMQLMPATASLLGVDPSQAEQNAQGGARYLRDLLIRFHFDAARALAAYNAGPGAVAKSNGVPAIAETVRYVQKVLAEYARLQKLAKSTNATD